jgi:hypothetical protein
MAMKAVDLPLRMFLSYLWKETEGSILWYDLMG